MGFPTLSSYYLSVMVLLPAFCYCDPYFTYSRATYYGTPDFLGTPSGACGFGEYGRTVNGGNVGAVSSLYKNGAGCGACYQVRCKIQQICSDDGANVVVTDQGEGDRTDFILSVHGYKTLARAGVPKAAADLLTYGVVDVEYSRIPCKYPGYNLKVKVHENSRFPEYLAIVMLYQGGVYQVTAVEIWLVNSNQWRGMRNAYGGVWDMPNPPYKGDYMSLRLQLISGDGGGGGGGGSKYVQLNGVVPSAWKPGIAYDSNIQL